MKKFVKFCFIFLVFFSLISPLLVFKDLLFPYITSKAYFFRILIEAALPFYLYLIAFDSRLRPDLRNPLTFSLIIFFLINLMSAIFGINVIRSLWGNYERMGGVFYLLHLLFFYFYILLLAQLDEKLIKKITQGLLIVSSFVAINGVSGWLGGPIVIQDPSLPARVSSTLGNPIFLASLLILPMFLLLFFGLSEVKKGKKVIYFVLAFLHFWGIILSGTRGALVGLIIGVFIGLIFYVFFERRKKVKLIGISVLGISISAVILMFIFSKHLPENSVLRRLTRLNDTNASARLIQWQIALEGYKDKPILGVGPENYYVVANKYWNPEMYKYDGSWFDKPHNYWLEILVTNGIVGFGAYIVVFIFTLYAFYYAYNKEVLSLKEFCVLIAGSLTYQIQNLFVFDTVSPSIMFFGFTGFASYLWMISGSNSSQQKNNKNFHGLGQNFSRGVFFTALVIMAYLQFATNFTGIGISKKVNYAYAYSSVDPKIAKNYFDELFVMPFNFDIAETNGKFADFAVTLAQRNDPNLGRDYVLNVLNAAIEKEGQLANRLKNDPIAFQRLANLYLFQSHLLNNRDFSQAEEAINNAISLVPNRTEAWQILFQVKVAQNKIDEAEEIINRIIEINPTRADYFWHKAVLYAFTSRQKEGVKFAEEAISKGFIPTTLQELNWLIEHYKTNKENEKLLNIFLKLNELKPGNTQLVLGLADAFVRTGNKTKALEILNYFLPLKAGEEAKQIKEFISSIK